jgi:hypothetical protein
MHFQSAGAGAGAGAAAAAAMKEAAQLTTALEHY